MDMLKPKKIIDLRPHHFLCLPGYKGYAYSKEHANNWDKISIQVLHNPNTKVKIVEGNDTLCLNCPNATNKGIKCNQNLITELDNKVMQLLGLVTGQVYNYSKVLDNLKQILNPQKHAELCNGCHWRNIGLCKDTFNKTNETILKPLPQEESRIKVS